MRLVFLPGGHGNAELHDGGEVIMPGEVFERDDDRAMELLTYPGSEIHEADASADQSKPEAEGGVGQPT